MRAATIGMFDGVHRGHVYLIEQLRYEAERRDMESLAVTFPLPPRSVIDPSFEPLLLTSMSEKSALLRSLGVGAVERWDFTPAMSRQTVRDTMLRLRDGCGVRVLVMGYDHRFGHDGRTADYELTAREVGIEVVRAKELPGEHVSSSRIRALLSEGKICEATSLLGHPYALGGEVVPGQRIGRTLGCPTANLRLSDPKLVPAEGVYAVRVRPEGGEVFAGMLNIGRRPTIEADGERTIEVCLLDFRGDLYGEALEVEFVDWLRSERRFPSREALAEQLRADEAAARKAVEKLHC